MRPFAILACVFIFFGEAQAQRSEFHIFKGEDQVGSIQVERSQNGERIHYSMDSYSEFNIIWSQVVRTSVISEYHKGMLTYCHSFLKVNDDVRDSSHMSMRSGSARCYVHPDVLEQCSSTGEWSTARMYFEEPVNATLVFVESILRPCPLIASGNGTYTLTFPNNTKNHYFYRNGELQHIQVIRPLFDLLFRRA